MARLYVDEDLGSFVPRLRDSGHDTAFAAETGAGRTDAWHLQQASVEGRVFVTFNERDFRYLHRLWTSLRIFQVLSRQHAGIVTATAQLEADHWLGALQELLVAPENLAGRMLVWHPGKPEWREDAWRPED